MRVDGGFGRPALAVLLGLAAAASALAGATAPPAASHQLAGVWSGVRRFGPAVRGTLTLEREDGRWRAEVAGFRPVVAAEGEMVSFELPGDRGRFRGRVDPEDGVVHGQWNQPGVTAAFGQRFSTPVRLEPAVPGRWRGTIRPLDDEVRLFLVVERSEGGVLRAFLRNPEVNFGRFFGPLELRLNNGEVELRGRLAWRPEDEPQALLSGAYRDDVDRIELRIDDLGGTFDLTRLDPDSDPGFLPRPPVEMGAPLWAPAAREDGWRTARPEEVGLARGPIEALVRAIESAPIDRVEAPAIDALLVARQGRLVVEEYFHRHSAERTHDVRSASKSLTATLVGAAVHAGTLRLETPVIATLNGGIAPPGTDPRAARITVEHLLAMDSGLPCDDWDPESPGGEDRVQSQEAESDWHRLLLALPMEREPGERAAYCSVGMSLAGAVAAQAAGEPLADLFDRLLARPLEMGAYHTNLMPDGEAYAGGGLRITARDFLKFGQLMLDDGVWNGRRLLDPGWAATVLARRHDLGNERLGTYTAGWWLLDFDVDGRTLRAFYAGGNGGNYLLAVPELDLVIVFQASNYNQAVQHRTKLEDVPRYLLRAALQGEPGEGPSGGVLPASDDGVAP